MEARVPEFPSLCQGQVHLSTSACCLSQIRAPLNCCPFSTESSSPGPSYVCIFPSRPRTRRQHFPQGSRLQKKLMPMRKMSFKLLKRCVAPVGPLEFLFPSSGEKLPLHPQLCKVDTQVLLDGLSHPSQFPFLTCPTLWGSLWENITLGLHCKGLCRHVKEALVVGVHSLLLLFLFQQRIQSLMTKMTAMANEEVRGDCMGGAVWRWGCGTALRCSRWPPSRRDPLHQSPVFSALSASYCLRVFLLGSFLLAHSVSVCRNPWGSGRTLVRAGCPCWVGITRASVVQPCPSIITLARRALVFCFLPTPSG